MMSSAACLLFVAGFSLFPASSGVAGPSRQFDIRAYGAQAGVSDKSTAAIQQAIKACAAGGGGTVVIPAGTYIVGPLELVSNVTLCLEAGAVLKGSEDLADYGQGRGRRPLIWATDAENIAIVGRGIIDGSGTTFMDMTNTRTGPYLPKDLDPNFTRQGRDYMDAKFGTADGPVVYRNRPNRLIRFTHCQNVLVREVTLRNAPTWTLHFDDCENVTVTGLSIQNNLLVPNSDGIHCTTCRRVRISDCDISCGDDAIAITTLDNPADRVCQGITVTNCILQSRSAGVRVGYGDGPIRDCTFQNLTIRESNRGLGLFVRDAGSLENILFANIAIRTRLYTGHWWGHAEPIHVSVISQRKDAPVGRIKNVSFSHIMAESESGILIYGDKPGDISGVSLDDVRLHVKAGPLNASYGGNFDLRPAYDTRYAIFRHDIPALFCRHVDGCTISRFEITWDDNLPEFFDHAISCEHFRNLVIDGFRGRQPHAGDQRAVLALTDGENVIIRNCLAAKGTGTFLSWSDLKDGGLFVNNDLRAAQRTFAPDQGSLVLSGNRMPAQP